MTDRDAARFRKLFDDHFSYVWGALRRLGVRAEDAEDRALEVFLTIHEKLSTYDEGRPIRPWLFGFAYRVASHARRAEGRRKEVFGVDPALAAPGALPDDLLIESEERSILADALAALDLDKRAVLVMHDWLGEPIPEVARALEIPLNTAYSRLRLARVDLAEAVQAVIERGMIDDARSKLASGDAQGALDRLTEHAQRFPKARLDEEREALAIQALANAGRTQDARARAKAFRARWPTSVYGAAVDATLESIP